MATGTAGTNARELPWQALAHYRKRINYNDAATTVAVKRGTLPNGCRLLGVLVYVKTAFNGGSTNTLSIGTNSTSYNNMATTSDVDLTAATKGTWIWRGMDIDITADTDWYTIYTDGSANSSAGIADVMPVFIQNN